MHRVALDGEIVALDKNGRPDFQALQHPSRAHLIVFYAFDVLHLNGRDMHKQTLEKRRSKLSDVVGDSGIRVSVELPGTAANVIASVQALGLEGVVAKLRTSPYDPALEDAWVKVRFDRHQELVVGGYQGDRTTFAGLEASRPRKCRRSPGSNRGWSSKCASSSGRTKDGCDFLRTLVYGRTRQPVMSIGKKSEAGTCAVSAPRCQRPCLRTWRLRKRR
jgi:hypothetical protein